MCIQPFYGVKDNHQSKYVQGKLLLLSENENIKIK